jgi:hypothetical protein
LKPKTQQTILCVGIATAIAAGTLIAIRMDLERTPQTEVKKVAVLVPWENLEVGRLFATPWHGGHGMTMPFVQNQFPLDTVPEDAVRTFAELEGQRLLRPLKPFQFVTRRDLIEDAKYMASRTKAVTLKNLGVRFDWEPNWLAHIWSRGRHEKICFHHGLLGYIPVLCLMESPPDKYGTTLVRLEGVLGYIRLDDGTYTVTIRVTPEEAEWIAQAQKKRRINVCQLEHWQTEPRDVWIRLRYERRPDSFLIFCKQLFSGVLIW